MFRRSFLFGGIGAAVAAVLAACTNGTIDPQKVADAIKAACGILVPVATIAAIISAGAGGTAQAVVDLVCSSYMSAKAAREKSLGAPAAGSTVHFIVHVNGQDIPVDATVQ